MSVGGLAEMQDAGDIGKLGSKPLKRMPYNNRIFLCWIMQGNILIRKIDIIAIECVTYFA